MLCSVNSSRRLAFFVSVIVVLSWAACGGEGVEGVVDPTGGEVCLPDKKVCISVPIGGIETREVLRIGPSSDVPGGAMSEAYEIEGVARQPIVFVKPATVTFSLDLVKTGELQNESLLRLYTRERLDGGALGEWQPLQNAFVDRVRNQLRGQTRHLSPFVVMRSDRLPDGGEPFEVDAGMRDASVIVVPPFDGGRTDAGRDAGTRDAGPPDAGARDAGPPDAGAFDAGSVDAGALDAGPDAGDADAGPPDAGVLDAGEPDAGEPDAGDLDAGSDGGADAGDAG